MKNVKRNIALFYVALILIFKVVGLHSLSHQVDDTDVQHCEVCLVSTAASFTPLLETAVPVVPVAEYYFLEQKFNSTVSVVVFNNRQVSSTLLPRPPPLVS